jgi:poly(beta-D-mannuronate) lyase
MIADSITINNNSFINNSCNFFLMNEEKEDKGYYNAEKISIGHNNFSSQTGTLLNIYRGGSDESTLGPNLTFSHNKLSNCSGADPLITLTGVQVSNIFSNNFSNCNPSSTLILYKDLVRARHSFEKIL